MKMKKIILLMLLLVGCSKQVKCSKDDNIITITENKNIIKNIEVQKKFNDYEEAKNYCTLLKLIEVEAKCEKNSITYKNYKDFLNKDFLRFDELYSYLENDNYICK